MITQKKVAAELATRRPQGKVIPISFYYNQRKVARPLKVLASFSGTNRDFRRYLREGGVTPW